MATMTTMYIRNVPEELARRAKVEAAKRGISMKEFILGAIEQALQSNGSTAKGSI